jgi:hypothetical protein
MKDKPIKITGVEKYSAEKKILGYAVCRQWRDNPRNVDVYEYADSRQEAKQMIKKLRKDNRYKWFIGVYQ